MNDISDLSRDMKSILDYKATDKMMVSLYLNVDAARVLKKDFLTSLNSMIVNTRSEIEKYGNYSKSQKKNISDLMEKIKVYINETFLPGTAKTLLLYVGEDGTWSEVKLPIILKDKIIIDPKPHTQVLRSFLNNVIRYGILLIDREKAQIYLAYLGEIKGYLGAFISDVPPKVNFRREAAFKEKNILSRIEEKLHHFFKAINSRTMQLLREGKFDNLILAGRSDVLSQFNNYMHSFLQQKCIGSILAEPDDAPREISEKAKVLIQEYETGLKSDMIDRLLDEYNPNGTGVLGVKAVIGSLMLEQVRTLLIDADFSTPGYVCESCGFITVEKKEECPYCKGDLLFYNDITDEIIEVALKQNCEVFDVSANQRLIEAGNIGAILRFKL